MPFDFSAAALPSLCFSETLPGTEAGAETRDRVAAAAVAAGVGYLQRRDECLISNRRVE